MILTVKSVKEFCRKAVDLGCQEIGISPVYAATRYREGFYHFGCIELSGFGAYEIHAMITIDSVVVKKEGIPAALQASTENMMQAIKDDVISELNGKMAFKFVEGIFGQSQAQEAVNIFGQAVESKYETADKENEPKSE